MPFATGVSGIECLLAGSRVGGLVCDVVNVCRVDEGSMPG